MFTTSGRYSFACRYYRSRFAVIDILLPELKIYDRFAMSFMEHSKLRFRVKNYYESYRMQLVRYRDFNQMHFDCAAVETVDDSYIYL